ncbi:transposase [Kitasatospora sp. NPDC091207]|uniref:transposase n=1 Tax=Kitasatospora sp. NPDC091207 TaxID=3364083 RepID=UPI0037F6A89C
MSAAEGGVSGLRQLVREATGLILAHPHHRPAADHVVLKELRYRGADLDAACDLVAWFASILVNRRCQAELERWAPNAEAGVLPELRALATGLRTDRDAVIAGLTLRWTSGPVEGHVHRIKMIKRHIFARAKPDLLRKRRTSHVPKITQHMVRAGWKVL